MRFSEAYEEYCKEFTDAPEVFHRFCSYFLISCVLSRKAYLHPGDRRVFPNIWMVLVAPSSFYHKSTSLHIAEKILDHVAEDFKYPNEFSQEKMLQIFQKQPEGAFFFDEAASLFGMLGKDYNRSAEAMFTTLYGGGKYKRITGMKDEQITTVTDPFINILGASTIDWLVKTISETSMTGGFIPRFIFIPASERKKILPFQPKASISKMNALISELGNIRSTCLGEATLTPDTLAAHHEWYMNFVSIHDHKDKKVQPFLSRLADDYILKFSIIIAADRREFPHITLPAFTEAKLAVEFIARKFEEVIADEIGNNPFQRNLNRVLKTIRLGNGSPITMNILYSKTKMSKREMSQVLETLIDSNLIDQIQLQTHTKTATAFIPHVNGNAI